MSEYKSPQIKSLSGSQSANETGTVEPQGLPIVSTAYIAIGIFIYNVNYVYNVSTTTSGGGGCTGDCGYGYYA